MNEIAWLDFWFILYNNKVINGWSSVQGGGKNETKYKKKNQPKQTQRGIRNEDHCILLNCPYDTDNFSRLLVHI